MKLNRDATASYRRLRGAHFPGWTTRPVSSNMEKLRDGRRERRWPIGAVAQLGERCVRNAEVEGSIPFRSTPRNPLTPLVSGLFLLTDKRTFAAVEAPADFVRLARPAAVLTAIAAAMHGLSRVGTSGGTNEL